jgi:hypothetical protein
VRRTGRWLLAGVAGAACLFAAGCGTDAITVTGGVGSTTLSVVVQSDSAGIALVKKSVASANSTLSGTVTDGDNHVGRSLCSFHVSKDGNSYDVDFYASGLPAGVTASDFCSTAVKNAFLDGLPSS